MSRRGGTVYEERDYYSREGPPPAPPPPPPAPVRTRERERDYEELDIYSRREREPERGSRPDFLREDYGRPDPGQLVLRDRKEETFRRPRSPSPTRSVYRERVIQRSPSPPPVRIREQRTERVIRSPSPPPPVRIREQRTERVIQKSPSPPPFERVRIIERERDRSPTPPPERLRARMVETRERIRERSPSPARSVYRERVVERERTPSPPPVRIRERIVERERERSPSPPPVRIRERIVERERERSPSPPRIENIRIRNFERERLPSPSPSPSPSPPPTIRAPPIHQEIITHHRHIDHGFELARAPSPPPPPRRREKETDIDIHTSRNNTEIDIKQTSSRSRTPQPTSTSLARREKFYDDDSSIFEGERDTLKVRDTKFDISSRRSVSARPAPRERERVRVDIRDDESEGDYYRRRADERAYIGEAYNGATKDWAIVDVPPGTERVQMDGVGGGSEEITWQRYNGVRRSKFIPERDRFPARAPERLPERGVERERERIEIRDEPRREGSGMEIEISSSRRREGSGSYEREYERIEESSDRRIGMPRPPPKARDESLWTEITKDLVSREAIEEMGYDFEETEFFFYIIQYLKYEDVLELVKITEKIRRERQERIREIERERERIERRDRERDEWERFDRRKEREVPPYDDERIIEREIIYEGGRRGPPPRRGGGW
ncbi:hypothetical protein LARI1_G008124 [Lachnellula arida]|uniref:DUF8035 domain-containing protein n=1 Tax=Lachnellula arida TaxID=1316785 RepID=A0A8T9B132_9HELO|nr:hypothetical protein LARI1_G008124 [Lachnellula arida]